MNKREEIGPSESKEPSKTMNFSLRKSGKYVFDWEKIKTEKIIIKVNPRITADILEIGSPNEQNIIYKVKESATLNLSIVTFDQLGNGKKEIIVFKGSTVEVAHADFSSDSRRIEQIFILQEVGATAHYHLATVASHEDEKEFSVSFFHEAENTTSKMDNYGVVSDKAKLHFTGMSHIKNGSIKSKAHQTGKIMVFDEKSLGRVQPVLKIDENNVEASHAAAVGRVNDEHLFYLCSRGLTEKEAKRIIILGYLKPIMKYFIDEEIKAQIHAAIERRI